MKDQQIENANKCIKVARTYENSLKAITPWLNDIYIETPPALTPLLNKFSKDRERHINCLKQQHKLLESCLNQNRQLQPLEKSCDLSFLKKEELVFLSHPASLTAIEIKLFYNNKQPSKGPSYVWI